MASPARGAVMKSEKGDADYTELNIDKALDKWATEMFEAMRKDEPDGNTAAKTQSNQDKREFKFNLERLRFQDGRPIFTNGKKLEPQSMPATQVIFEDTFRNDTTLTQKHRMRCVRETTSLVQVDLRRAIVCENRTRLQLSQVPAEIANKSGFLNQLEIRNIKSHDFTEKLVWEVDDEIEVPARSLARAEVAISEEQHEREFKIQTTIAGNVHCDVMCGDQYTSFDGDIKEILKNAKMSKLLDSSGGAGVTFTSSGHCRFRYAIKKRVNVYSDEN